MWSRIKHFNKSAPNLASPSQEYNKQNDYDFSDGPRPGENKYPMPLVWPQSFGKYDGRYPITDQTMSAFMESLALEPLVAPLAKPAPIAINLIPPTPPWVTPPELSRRGSKEGSPPRDGRDSPGHKKALSDTPWASAVGRTDALRRGREASIISATQSKAAVNPDLARRVGTDWHKPFRAKGLTISIPPPRSSSLHRDPPSDVPKDALDSPPFPFDD